MTNRVREVRKGKGLTLTALAVTAAVDPSSLSVIERGKIVSMPVARRLAKALRVPPGEIFPNFKELRRW